MPDLKSQRIIASRLLKCGLSRVYIDPVRISDVKEAITAADVRQLINDGVIAMLRKKGVSRVRARKRDIQKSRGRRKGHGSRKGHKAGIRKKEWVSLIRALRSEMRKLSEEGKISTRDYRHLYLMAKGGFFRSRSHLMVHLQRNNLLKKEETGEKK